MACVGCATVLRPPTWARTTCSGARPSRAAGIVHGGRPARGAVGSERTVRRTLIAAEDKIEMEGEVLEAFPSGMFSVVLDNGHELIAYTAGKMRRHRIRMAPGDRVKVEVSAYDLNRGRIVYRHR